MGLAIWTDRLELPARGRCCRATAGDAGYGWSTWMASCGITELEQVNKYDRITLW